MHLGLKYMNDNKLAAYKVPYNEGTFFLHTEKEWSELYAIPTEKNKTLSRHLFQIHFVKSAYDYGSMKTPNKKIYVKGLPSVSEERAWYQLQFGKSKHLPESDGRIAFRKKKQICAK